MKLTADKAINLQYRGEDKCEQHNQSILYTHTHSEQKVPVHLLEVGYSCGSHNECMVLKVTVSVRSDPYGNVTDVTDAT
jgi:hypothetical protein